MRFIPTSVHGVLDYLVGLYLVGAPWIVGFGRGGAETWVPVVLGAGAIGYSLFTDYELGAIRRIPMRTHLTLDVASGALLAVSPWLFGFAHVTSTWHVVLGVFEMLVALATRTVPAIAGTRHGLGGRMHARPSGPARR